MDPHARLARSETAATVTPCADCARPWQGNVTVDGAPVCDQCHAAALLEWYDWDSDGDLTGVTPAGITVARVSHAKEGEAEGGLYALCRLMAGALHPDVALPPPSPAGWYWVGTPDEPGRWTSAAGPFATAEEARDAAAHAFAHGAYLTGK